MKKYVLLIAGLTTVSAFANGNGRDSLSIGNRLGDGAYMKATGMSAVEWAAQCGRQQRSEMNTPYRSYSYSETQRLMPEQTPISTETLQGQSGTVASSVNSSSSVSAGPSTDANYSATATDVSPTPGLTDNHNLGAGNSASVITGKEISNSYNEDHSPIYTDKTDVAAAGSPAKSERGNGSSSASLPIGEALSPTVASDLEWTAQIRSDLMQESPANTSSETFTRADLENVQIRRSNGVVTLTGRVPSERMKRNLEKRVKDLAGGATVDNQLSIAPSADLPANGSSVPRD